jgi:hypothetical protein
VKHRLADLACVVGLAALLLVSGLSRYRDGIDLGDEGWLAYGAVRVLSGEMPSRDFFVTQPPLAFYSLALAFQAFGVSIETVRGVGLALYVLIPLLLFGIARQLMSRPAALLAAAPAAVLGISFFQFSPRAVWHGIALSLASALLALLGLARGGARRIALCAGAGALAALAVASRHDVGGYLSIATVATALVFDRRRGLRPRFLWPWSAGALAVALPLALFWWGTGAAIPMFQQLVLFLATRYPETSGIPFPQPLAWIPLPTGGLFPGLFFFLPPLVIVAAAFVWARSRRRSSRVAFVILLAALFYLQVGVRSDPWHLVMTLSPCFVLVAWLFDRLRLALPAQLAALALAAAALFGLQQLVRPPPDGLQTVLDVPAGGVRLSPTDALFVRAAIEKTQAYARPDQPIFVVPYQPMLYVLTQRRNPTRWNYLWPGDQSDEDFAQLLQDLERDPPAVVLVFRTDEVVLPSALHAYLAANYRLVEQVGALGFYLPLRQRR